MVTLAVSFDMTRKLGRKLIFGILTRIGLIPDLDDDVMDEQK